MNSLFENTAASTNEMAYRPLADRLRPKTLEEILGQHSVLMEGSMLRQAIAHNQLPSLILWGPPGCGKTTLARALAHTIDARFVPISAITSNTAELRKHFELAAHFRTQGQRTLVFIDEIHRFNKTQQDLFLPVVEDGTITLLGATTENPSFALNAALLSRCKVLVLKSLSEEELAELVIRAEQELGAPLPLTEDARAQLSSLAAGDARYLLNLCEELSFLPPHAPLDASALMHYVSRRQPLYDKAQEAHYNLLSAFHKSLRASDGDAALYWLARALDAGEDALTIIRRLTACASEDVGLADPNALVQALAAKQAYEFLGLPEAQQCIAQAVLYVALAPKSNRAYLAFHAAMADAKHSGNLQPPMHAMNAPTKLMKELGYKEGYLYDHDTPEGIAGMQYLPSELQRQRYYQPVERGLEREMQKRMEYIEKLRGRRKAGNE